MDKNEISSSGLEAYVTKSCSHGERERREENYRTEREKETERQRDREKERDTTKFCARLSVLLNTSKSLSPAHSIRQFDFGGDQSALQCSLTTKVIRGDRERQRERHNQW